VREEWERLSEDGFQECFQNLYSHWQECIVAQAECFEADVAETIVLFCIAQQ